MTVLITLTTAGTDSGPFNLYTDFDGYVTPIETGVAKVALTGGYTSTLVPDLATIIRVTSTGSCINHTDITLVSITTTTTSTTAIPYASWDVSTLSSPVSATACGYTLDQVLYSTPSTLDLVAIFYLDPALTTPYVGSSNWYHVREGLSLYVISIDEFGNTSGFIGC